MDSLRSLFRSPSTAVKPTALLAGTAVGSLIFVSLSLVHWVFDKKSKIIKNDPKSVKAKPIIGLRKKTRRASPKPKWVQNLGAVEETHGPTAWWAFLKILRRGVSWVAPKDAECFYVASKDARWEEAEEKRTNGGRKEKDTAQSGKTRDAHRPGE